MVEDIEELINHLLGFANDICDGIPKGYYETQTVTDAHIDDISVKNSLRYYETLLDRLKIFDIKKYRSIDERFYNLCEKWYNGMVREVETYVEQDKLLLEPSNGNAILQSEQLIIKMRKYETDTKEAVKELGQLTSQLSDFDFAQ